MKTSAKMGFFGLREHAGRAGGKRAMHVPVRFQRKRAVVGGIR